MPLMMAMKEDRHHRSVLSVTAYASKLTQKMAMNQAHHRPASIWARRQWVSCDGRG